MEVASKDRDLFLVCQCTTKLWEKKNERRGSSKVPKGGRGNFYSKGKRKGLLQTESEVAKTLRRKCRANSIFRGRWERSKQRMGNLGRRVPALNRWRRGDSVACSAMHMQKKFRKK